MLNFPRDENKENEGIDNDQKIKSLGQQKKKKKKMKKLLIKNRCVLRKGTEIDLKEEEKKNKTWKAIKELWLKESENKKLDDKHSDLNDT